MQFLEGKLFRLVHLVFAHFQLELLQRLQDIAYAAVRL